MAPEEGTASCRHRAAREGEPRMGLTARGEPGPQKGDRKGQASSDGDKCPHGHRGTGTDRIGGPLPTTAPDSVRSVAAMRAPIFGPLRRETAADHRAGDIARAGRRAEGGGTGAAGPAARHTAHGRPANKNMARPVPPLRLPQQTGEMIARRYGVGIGTGMACAAAAIHLARRDARETDMRPFGAPDRPVAVPHCERSTCEGLAGRNDRGEQEQSEHQPALTLRIDRFKRPNRPKRQRMARSAHKKRALGEPAAGRRARGLGGQPPPGKDGEPSALRGQNIARPLAPRAGARARPIEPRSIRQRQLPGVQLLERMTCRGSPHRPHGAFNNSKPRAPPAACVAVPACATDERSSRSAMHSSQSGVPSMRRTSASTRSAVVDLVAMRVP